MRKLKQKGFERVSEGERRRNNSRCMAIVSLIGMVVFIAAIVVGGIFGEDRYCTDSQVVERGACVDCIENCRDCNKTGSTGCD